MCGRAISVSEGEQGKLRAQNRAVKMQGKLTFEQKSSHVGFFVCREDVARAKLKLCAQSEG